MIPLPSRSRALTLVSAAGLGLLCCGPTAAFLTGAAAQTADPSPAAAPAQPAGQPAAPATDSGVARTDAKGRHLAPHGTLYLLSYVPVTTDTGVDGLVPGQEVHVISADRPKHTLLVTDGKVQVEVSPAKLTNDIDIAAMARQKDQANQARIAAYTQTEEAAFGKREREEAEAEAKNDERQKQEAQQVAETRLAESAQGAQNAQQPVDASPGGSGYYDSGGYGYGNPYSYFFATGASGPGGGRGTLPSHEAINSADVEHGGAGGAAAGGAHAGGAGGGGHPGGGGGGKP